MTRVPVLRSSSNDLTSLTSVRAPLVGAELFVHDQVGLVGAHPIPINRHTQTWTVRHGYMAARVDGVQLVGVVARVDGRLGAAEARVDQAELVVIGVANGGHAVAVGRS